MVVDEMRRFIPHLRRIRFTKVPVERLETEYVRFGDEAVERQSKRKFQGDAILFDFDNAKNVSAHTASEGTLLLLGLLTILFCRDSPRILRLDDIAHGLHPLAQKAVLDVLVKLMKRFPNLQVLASAHSPYLLDELQPHQTRLMAVDDNGYAVCGRLADHPQFERWKDEMAPGELWSLFGEKWVADRSQAG